MYTDDSAKAVQRSVAILASDAHMNFEVKSDGESQWRCHEPGRRRHSFCLLTRPGVIVMWGDIGEYVWRVPSSDALGWCLAQGRAEGDHPDYFLSKLSAARGPTKTFYSGDALSYAEERIADGDERWKEVRSAFVTLRKEYPEETSWAMACRAQGIADPPSCAGWTSTALWSWYAIRTFARLLAGMR